MMYFVDVFIHRYYLLDKYQQIFLLKFLIIRNVDNFLFLFPVRMDTLFNFKMVRLFFSWLYKGLKKHSHFVNIRREIFDCGACTV